MQKECEYCGRSFNCKRRSKKYCSGNCKQMAYYKRNGLVLAGHSVFSSASIKNVKYDTVKDVKYDAKENITESLVNTIAERLLILIENRIDKNSANFREHCSVQPYFALNDKPSFDKCNSCTYKGFAKQHGVTVKENMRATVKASVHTVAKPLVEMRSMQKIKRKKQRELTKVEAISLQNERTSAQDSLTEELEFALRNFTVASDAIPGVEFNDSKKSNASSKPFGQIKNNEEVTNTENSNDLLTVEADSANVKYEWVESSFLKHVEDYLIADNYDLQKYQSSTAHMEMLECFKCLLWTVVQLSNRSEVDSYTLQEIVFAYSQLIQSENFKSLSEQFPYRSLILEIQQKISNVANASQCNGPFQIRLSVQRKAMLIASRFKMGNYIKDVKFKEIFY
jgi:hypothetical protein